MTFTETSDLKGESLQLLRAYHQAPSLKLRNRLVEMNFGLVRREAYHWLRLNLSNESYEDLIQIGCIGLINAIERFDMSKGNAFSSFATPYIRGEIQHYLRDKSPSVRIPRRWQELHKRAESVTKQLYTSLGRVPTEAELAEALDITPETWQEVRSAMRNRTILSLDAPVTDGDEGAAAMVDLMPDPRYKSFQLAQEDRIRLQQCMVKLEEKTREVLEFVFLHDLTQKETADRLGVSAITVSRHLKKGLQNLTKLMTGPDEEI
jgi:RNA polymerase sigma-B factor